MVTNTYGELSAKSVVRTTPRCVCSMVRWGCLVTRLCARGNNFLLLWEMLEYNRVASVVNSHKHKIWSRHVEIWDVIVGTKRFLGECLEDGEPLA